MYMGRGRYGQEKAMRDVNHNISIPCQPAEIMDTASGTAKSDCDLLLMPAGGAVSGSLGECGACTEGNINRAATAVYHE